MRKIVIQRRDDPHIEEILRNNNVPQDRIKTCVSIITRHHMQTSGKKKPLSFDIISGDVSITYTAMYGSGVFRYTYTIGPVCKFNVEYIPPNGNTIAECTYFDPESRYYTKEIDEFNVEFFNKIKSNKEKPAGIVSYKL